MARFPRFPLIPLAVGHAVTETRGNGRALPVGDATPMPQETTLTRAEPDSEPETSELRVESMDIGGVLREAWHEVRAKWFHLSVALLPVAALAVMLEELFGEQGPFEPSAPELVRVVVWAAMQALFALICHRIVLLGPGRMSHWAEWVPLRRYGVFLLIFLALDILTVAALWSQAQLLALMGTHLTGLITAILMLVLFLSGIVAVLYAATRASLILPAAAIGRFASPAVIWRWSRGKGWRLTIAVVASFFVAWMFWGPLLLLSIQPSWPAEHPVLRFLVGLAYFVPVPYVIAVLSCAYRALEPESRPTPIP